MKPNPGGTLDPKDIIGRDKSVTKMYEILQDRSIVLVSERRIGKTSVLRKLEDFIKKEDDIVGILILVEGIESPIEFVNKIYDKLSENEVLSKRKRMWRWLEKKYQNISGQEIGNWHLPSIKENWKELLHALMEDIKEHSDPKIVLMFDEFPLMLDKIAKQEDPETAMTLLDNLRDIRQEDDSGKIRMIYCGSIGLHIVIFSLKEQGYKNEPINDMETISLEPLEEKYSIELIEEMSKQCNLRFDEKKTMKYVAESVDNFPFYLHSIMADFNDKKPQLISKDEVDAVLDGIILDPHDRMGFDHYIGRIYTHYPKKLKKYAFFILDFLAKIDKKLSFQDIWNEVKTHHEVTDKEVIRRVMKLLVKDHYLKLSRTDGGIVYEFKYGIIKKWWKERI